MPSCLYGAGYAEEAEERGALTPARVRGRCFRVWECLRVLLLLKGVAFAALP
jgi:hypothetical protein